MNANQLDKDGDGVGDVCDVCPLVADPLQADADQNGIGDACESGDDPGPGDTPGDPGNGGTPGSGQPIPSSDDTSPDGFVLPSCGYGVVEASAGCLLALGLMLGLSSARRRRR